MVEEAFSHKWSVHHPHHTHTHLQRFGQCHLLLEMKSDDMCNVHGLISICFTVCKYTHTVLTEFIFLLSKATLVKFKCSFACGLKASSLLKKKVYICLTNINWKAFSHESAILVSIKHWCIIKCDNIAFRHHYHLQTPASLLSKQICI
jgi:hypothetical protein